MKYRFLSERLRNCVIEQKGDLASKCTCSLVPSPLSHHFSSGNFVWFLWLSILLCTEFKAANNSTRFCYKNILCPPLC